MRLEGQRILVTGAGRGIGAVVVPRLQAEGAEVIGLARSRGDLERLQQETGCATLACDLATPEALATAVAPLLPLDGLVNCAGTVTVQPALDTDAATFFSTLAVNTVAPLVLAQLVARSLIERERGGAIVNVSSIASWVGTPGHAAYCASKAGLDALTRVLAVEWGAYGIRVNSVDPVVTRTPMAEKAWSDPDKAARMRARIPLGRFAEPEEVAAAVAFLLGPDAAMIHGISLPVDGGFSAG
ncbi:SDR family oxidoreductase [Sediminicurvatus halobius]|uniref:Short-chain dehydrogenase n=1 Tax=Sediminicurvatus halobius TaxID=2182432 RepID=A0A2U2N165_9GAMM|nr:SDR family oxidoreductase [Spiribacter halobius]PWG62787.1 short-chain dehydrogenase [Spiribacter halobius]UEX77066.1 SDR family oxidoreductase [Spiribacter halobius]